MTVEHVKGDGKPGAAPIRAICDGGAPPAVRRKRPEPKRIPLDPDHAFLVDAPASRPPRLPRTDHPTEVDFAPEVVTVVGRRDAPGAVRSMARLV